MATMNRMSNKTVKSNELFESLCAELFARGHEAHFRAHGVSMGDTVRDGDTVRVAALNGAEPREGEVLLAQNCGKWSLHRMMGRAQGSDAVVLKGDALAE